MNFAVSKPSMLPRGLARRWLTGLLVVGLAWAITSAAYAQTNGNHGGELLYGEAETVSRFDPYRLATARGASDRLFSLIYEGLVRYDYDAEEYEYVLASAHEVGDDGRTVIFTLRPNIRWHDGEPLTAEDVVFTYEYIKRIAPEQIRRPYDAIRSVEMLDLLTVQATFVGEVAEPLVYFDTWILPEHRYENYLPRPGMDSIEDAPIGTGPYIFRGRTIEGHVTLDVNENYWQQRGNIETLVMNKVTDPRQTALLVGSGIYRLMVQVPPDQIVYLKETQKVRIEQYASFGVYAFAYNCTHPILQDKVVRQALTYATNRQQMLDQWFNGKGHLLASPFNLFSPYYDPSLKPYPFDAAHARKLLDDAGYTDRNGDGIREAPGGAPLRFDLVNFVEDVASNTVNQNMASSYQNDLRQIGVEVNLLNLTLDEYRDRLFRDNDFDIALVQWTFDPIYDVTDLFSASAIGGNNIVQFENREVDTIIDLFQRQPDPEIRIDLMKSLQRVLADQSPYTFVLSPDKNAAFHRSLANTRIDPYYFFPYFAQWYIQADYQY